jgi:nifR3 family TIM-barrel protein
MLHFEDVVKDEQCLANNYVEEVHFADGSTNMMPTSPIEMASFETPATVVAPRVGANTEEVLKALGYDEEAVAAMLESGEYLGCTSEIPPAAIDINMGCPVHKVAGNGEGSALMKDPERAAEIVRAVCRAVSLPVTVKIRAGWDADHINAPELAKRLEDAGAALICVHGRTREQMYAPGVDYHVIGRVKQAVSIPVIGNGDLRSAKDAQRMLEISNCDGFMVARGATGNPWLFDELCAWMDGREYTPPTKEERLRLAMHHAELCVADKGERIGIPEIRKHIAWYLRGMNGAAAGRNRVMTASTLAEMRDILMNM